MSNSFPGREWQELYRAALFETDKSKAAERISDAEQVIRARVRSLFHHPDCPSTERNPDNPSIERNALDAALYALGVLKGYSRRQPSSEAANRGMQRSA
jgi:hypothetical protein